MFVKSRLVKNAWQLAIPAVLFSAVILLPVQATSWNPTHAYSLAQLEEHSGAVYGLAWSPDGNRLASGSKDGTVKIWNATTWQSILTINAHSNGVWSVAWSPDGTKLATSGEGGKACVWNPLTGQKLATLNVSNYTFVAVHCICWSPDSGKIVTGDAMGVVVIFNSATGMEQRRLSGHTAEVIAVAFSPNGSLLASGGIDATIRLWNPQNGLAVRTLVANTTERNDINGLAWSPDGAVLAAAGQDGNVRLWNSNLGVQTRILKHSLSRWTRGVVWSPDGQVLATTGQDARVRLWNTIDGRSLANLSQHYSPVWSGAWLPTRSLFASGSGEYTGPAGDTRVLVWNLGIPEADFAWTELLPQTGESVLFNASSSVANGGEILNYRWDFGDMSYGEGETTTHMYAYPGIYAVMLNITDSEGLSDVETKQLEAVALHNVVIASVVCSRTLVNQGFLVRANATVMNRGLYNETFSVSFYANTTLLAAVDDVGLGNRSSTVLFCYCNTTTFAKGAYAIKAVASVVQGEDYTIDNTFVNGHVKIVKTDINNDKKVNVLDLIIVANALGSRPGEPKWNSDADVNNDSSINVLDLIVVAQTLGS